MRQSSLLGIALLLVGAAVMFDGSAAVDMPWLTVKQGNNRYFIADDQGREGKLMPFPTQTILRGVNVEFLQRELDDARRPIDPADYDGKCPANKVEYYEPPVCQVDAGKGQYGQPTDFRSGNDFAQMRALGFNLVRLCLNWNLLEPQPGNYSQQYLDRIAQVVGWAKEQGIYVLLDMHQDQYSRFIFADQAFNYPPYLQPQDGQDGAPAWAVVTDGWPAVAIDGQGPFNLAVMAAVDNFYNNLVIPGLPQGDAPGPGLQDHFIGAIALLAKRFKNESTVVGYEIMNEPPPGFNFDLIDFSSSLLYPMYARVIQALTGVRDGLPTCPSSQPNSRNCAYPSLGVEDNRHLIFFEPMAIRNQFDVSFQNSAPFTSYPNLVFAPHVYTHIFTIDQVMGLPATNNIYPPSYDFAFTTARYEANAMKAALLVTEFGGAAHLDNITLIGTIEAQERNLVGSTMWSWKSNTGTDVSGEKDMWSVYAGPLLINGTMQPSGPILKARERFISRIYPRAVWGELLDFSYDSYHQSFTMSAVADAAGTTLIYIPPIVSGTVSIAASGAAEEQDMTTNPDNSRLVTIHVKGAGAYQVSIAPTGHAVHPPTTKARRTPAAELSVEGASLMKEVMGAYASLAKVLASIKGQASKLPVLLDFLASDAMKPLRRQQS